MLALGRLHQIAEVQMVGVHHRIHSHKVRLLVIAVLLVGLEKLAVISAGHDEQIAQEGAFGLIAQIGPVPVDDVAAVSGYGIGRDGRRFTRKAAQQRRVHDLRPLFERPGFVRGGGRRLLGGALSVAGQHRLSRAGREQAADQQQRQYAREYSMFHGRTTFSVFHHKPIII